MVGKMSPGSGPESEGTDAACAGISQMQTSFPVPWGTVCGYAQGVQYGGIIIVSTGTFLPKAY